MEDKPTPELLAAKPNWQQDGKGLRGEPSQPLITPIVFQPCEITQQPVTAFQKV